jgi:hypothetical protein
MRLGYHAYGLETSDSLRDRRIGSLGRFDTVNPLIIPTGPSHPAAFMPCPLGGHSQSGGQRCFEQMGTKPLKPVLELFLGSRHKCNLGAG